MYFSLVLGRAFLIGSQTEGISVLHNRVRRHREDGPRDSLGALEREAVFLEYTTLLLDITSSARAEDHHFNRLQKRFNYHDCVSWISPCIHSLNSYMPRTW